MILLLYCCSASKVLPLLLPAPGCMQAFEIYIYIYIYISIGTRLVPGLAQSECYACQIRF